MPNANSVSSSSSSSNNQNMEMNQGSVRRFAGGDGIYARELYNRIGNSNQHTETNDEIDDRINRLVNNSINRMRERVRMDNTPPICVISNPPYPNNSESSRRE